MNTKHLDPLRKELRALQTTSPPSPWRKITYAAVGGLRSVGFDLQSELLLVVSGSGRGVFDCTSGAMMARDDTEYFDNEFQLIAEGIGPLEGVAVRVGGLLGGGLPTSTADGWSVETVFLEWPVADLLLLEPFSSLYDSLRGRASRFHKIAAESELRAFGFSYSGHSLVIATSSELLILGRPAA